MIDIQGKKEEITNSKASEQTAQSLKSQGRRGWSCEQSLKVEK